MESSAEEPGQGNGIQLQEPAEGRLDAATSSSNAAPPAVPPPLLQRTHRQQPGGGADGSSSSAAGAAPKGKLLAAVLSSAPSPSSSAGSRPDYSLAFGAGGSSSRPGMQFDYRLVFEPLVQQQQQQLAIIEEEEEQVKSSHAKDARSSKGKEKLPQVKARPGPEKGRSLWSQNKPDRTADAFVTDEVHGSPVTLPPEHRHAFLKRRRSSIFAPPPPKRQAFIVEEDLNATILTAPIPTRRASSPVKHIASLQQQNGGGSRGRGRGRGQGVSCGRGRGSASEPGSRARALASLLGDGTPELTPDGGPAPGQDLKEWRISRNVDLYQEYEYLDGLLERINEMQKGPRITATIREGWTRFYTRLNTCFVVRNEIRKANCDPAPVPAQFLAEIR